MALLLAGIAAVACTDEKETDEPTEEELLAECQAYWDDFYAAELTSCNDICSVTVYITDESECESIWNPCDSTLCAAWCLENEDLTGACGAISGNFLSCDCYAEDAGV